MAGKATNGAIAAATLFAAATAVPYLVKWEGWENQSYPDVANVWTACAGTTRGVKPGQYYSDPKCETLLAQEAVEYGMAIAPCLPASLPNDTRAAFVVTAYNIGPKAFCGSSMSRKAMAGDLAGACASLDAWNKSAGRVVFGLVRRRSDERQLCERGLSPS